MATDSIRTAKTHSTIVAWEAATDNDLVTATEGEIGEVQTNEDFDAAHVMSGATVNSTFNRELRVADANYHNGLEGTGHARIYRTGTGHAVELNEAYFQLKGLDINLLSGQASSDECVRVNGIDPALIQKMLLHQDSSVGSCDGIYMGDVDARVFVDTCMLYFFQRFGIHAQPFSGARTQTWNLDFLTAMHCNIGNQGSAGNIMAQPSDASTVLNMNVFNTASMDSQGGTPLDFGGTGSGTINWAGSDNIAGTAAAEDKFTASFDSVTLTDADDSDPASGEHFWVNQKDHGSEDYRLNGENAFTVSQQGLDRVGSEPANSVWTTGIDPQDFSKDIAGRLRTGAANISIGAFNFTVGAAGRLMGSLAGRGGLAGPGGIAGIGGGLAG